MADVKISDIPTTETVLSAVAFLEGERADNTPVKIPVALLAGAVSGTAFPGSPATGQRLYRSDRNIEYFYDGTRWLSTQLHKQDFRSVEAVSSTTTIYAPTPWQGIYSLYLERLESTFFRSGTGEWDVRLSSITGPNVATTIATLDGAGDTSNNWVMRGVNIAAVLDTSARVLELQSIEISGSAAFYSAATLHYRLIG